MGKAPNRIAALLDGAPKAGPLAEDDGEEGTDPGIDAEDPDPAAKSDAGQKLLTAIKSGDGMSAYDAICDILNLENGAEGEEPEPEEET